MRLAGGSRAGAWRGSERVGSARALPRSRPCSVLASWWASSAWRFHDDGTPHGPRAGSVPRAGPTNIDSTGGLDAYF